MAKKSTKTPAMTAAQAVEQIVAKLQASGYPILSIQFQDQVDTASYTDITLVDTNPDKVKGQARSVVSLSVDNPANTPYIYVDFSFKRYAVNGRLLRTRGLSVSVQDILGLNSDLRWSIAKEAQICGIQTDNFNFNRAVILLAEEYMDGLYLADKAKAKALKSIDASTWERLLATL